MDKDHILSTLIGIVIGVVIGILLNKYNHEDYSNYDRSIDSLNLELNRLRESEASMRGKSDSLSIRIISYNSEIDSLKSIGKVKSDSVFRLSTDESIEFLLKYFQYE